MVIKCEEQKNAATGDSSSLIWSLTTTDNKGKLVIKRGDKIRLDGVPDGVKAEVHSERIDQPPADKQRTDNVDKARRPPWWFDVDAGIYKPDSKATGQVDGIAIELIIAKPENGIKIAVTITATINGEQQAPQKLEKTVPAGLPEIRGLRAVPSLISVQSPFRLQWTARNASSWKLFEDDTTPVDTKLNAAKPEGGWCTVTSQPLSRAEGRYIYRLVAGNDKGASIEARARLRVVDTKEWRLPFQPWEDDKTTGLCVGINCLTKAETLYAVVLSEPADTDPLGTQPTGGLWCSEDGLSWTCLSVDIPLEVLTSPVVALPSTDRNNPKPILIFVGGSKIDFNPGTPSNFSNKIYVVDLNNLDSKTGGQWKTAPWTPRAGHACLVLTDKDGVSKLCIIGGLSKNDQTLADAYVLSDPGQGKWDPIELPGWPGCYHFAAAAKQTGTRLIPWGPELWLAGGFQDCYNGDPYDELHIFPQQVGSINGAQAQPLQKDIMPEDDWRTSGVSLVVLNNWVYAFCTQCYGADVGRGTRARRSLFTSLEARDASKAISPFSPASPEQAGPDFDNDPTTHRRIEAVAFNGCIWVFSLHLETSGSAKLLSSQLRYWIPTKQEVVG